MAHGDYAFWRAFYRDRTTDLTVATGTQNYTDVIQPKTANHRLWVQKITLSITTHAAQTLTVDDDGTGPAIAAHTDAAAGAGVPSVVTWDFGPKGRPLTIGGNLDVTQSGAGIGGVLHIEAYETIGNPVAIANNN